MLCARYPALKFIICVYFALFLSVCETFFKRYVYDAAGVVHAWVGRYCLSTCRVAAVARDVLLSKSARGGMTRC